MAKVANKQTRIYLDQHDLSGVLTSTEQTLTQETVVTTTFADDGPRRIVGNYDIAHNDLGLFDGDTTAYDAVLDAARRDGADHYLGKLFGANAEGAVAYESIVKLAAQPRSAQEGQAVLLNFASVGTGAAFRGLVLGNAAVNAAGNRPGQNIGIKAADGTLYAVVFRLLAFNGTNITLKLQSSSDNGGSDAYADIAGLTSGALVAPGIVRVTTAAALEAWRRVAITGVFASATILVTAGIVK